MPLRYGERFLDRRLQSAVIREMIRIINIPTNDGEHWYFASKEVNIIYNGTSASSQGRRFLVDLFVNTAAVAGLSNELLDDTFNAEFILDIGKASFGIIGRLGYMYGLKHLKAEDYC